MSNQNRTTDDEPVRASELRDAFERRIGADRDENRQLWWALEQEIVAALDERDASARAAIDELARHFPGLALVIPIIWDEHVDGQPLEDVGRCCVVQAPPA